MGITFAGSVLIGLILVLGQRYYADNIVMWLASTDTAVALWRQIILSGLLTMGVVRAYYDNALLRCLWAASAVGLVWAGIGYGVGHGDHVLDAMFMLSAGICFAIAALQNSDEPLEWPAMPHFVAQFIGQKPHSREPALRFGSLTDVRDDSHNLKLDAR